MRASLEALAVRRFVQRAGDDQVRALRVAVDEIASSADAGEVGDHLGAKDRFYEVLMEGSASGPLQQTLAGLQARVRLLRGDLAVRAGPSRGGGRGAARGRRRRRGPRRRRGRRGVRPAHPRRRGDRHGTARMPFGHVSDSGRRGDPNHSRGPQAPQRLR